MEENNIYTLENENETGEVRIADDVVAVIAGLAATEIDGVASIYGNITNEIVSKLTKKSLSKGVKAIVSDNEVEINIILNVKFGFNIKEVTAKVQDKIKTSIENMTGLGVKAVNIRIANIVADANA
ncbi:Uncharacterized conserved protein YloU, alkaline shock protein (Asp23) family [Lachnospiraceae bacterium RM5]|nr:Uncharacterized conserved protein YloU, alkaline shock protein (Asp23) family [Lachnospiraceae bacterium RM5]